MNFEPAIKCLVDAISELGERLANLELLAETEYERARAEKYRGRNITAKQHLLIRHKYLAEAVRIKSLLRETEELIGKFQSVTAKHKLLKKTIPSDLMLHINTDIESVDSESVLISYPEDINAELQRMKQMLIQGTTPELDSDSELAKLKRSLDIL